MKVYFNVHNRQFAKELELELVVGFDIVHLSRWAHAKYLENNSIENDLDEIIMKIVAIEEGSEFEYTNLVLLQLAKDLQNKL